MLVIRKEQLAVFHELQLREFEDKTYARLLRFFPAQCASLGEKAVRDSIRKGMRTAKSYGISREFDVARYINIMYALSHDFDSDPRYAWAVEILTDNFGDKVDRLCELTKMELRNEQSI